MYITILEAIQDHRYDDDENFDEEGMQVELLAMLLVED